MLMWEIVVIVFLLMLIFSVMWLCGCGIIFVLILVEQWFWVMYWCCSLLCMFLRVVCWKILFLVRLDCFRFLSRFFLEIVLLFLILILEIDGCLIIVIISMLLLWLSWMFWKKLVLNREWVVWIRVWLLMVLLMFSGRVVNMLLVDMCCRLLIWILEIVKDLV